MINGAEIIPVRRSIPCVVKVDVKINSITTQKTRLIIRQKTLEVSYGKVSLTVCRSCVSIGDFIGIAIPHVILLLIKEVGFSYRIDWPYAIFLTIGREGT